MGVSFVQTASNTGTAASLAVTLPANPLPGSLLVMCIGIDNVTSISSVASTADTFTAASTVFTAGTDGVVFYYMLSSAGGANAKVVTMTLSGSSTIKMALHEYRGLTQVGVDVAPSYRQDASGANPTTPALTNVQAQALYVAFDIDGGNVTGCSAPFTIRNLIAGGHGSSDAIVSSQASRGCQFTTVSAVHNLATIVFSGTQDVVEKFNPLPLMSPGRI